jgi:hypothetical protein
MKNRTAEAADPEVLMLGHIRRLGQPRRRPNGHERSSLAANEGRAAVVTSTLARARGGSVDAGETPGAGAAGAFVRVTGWLMLDTEHISLPITRSTNWEVHPVAEFEVCTLTRCRAEEGWVTLDEFRP